MDTFRSYVALKIGQHRSALSRARRAREANRPDLHAHYLGQCAVIRDVLQRDLTLHAMKTEILALLKGAGL